LTTKCLYVRVNVGILTIGDIFKIVLFHCKFIVTITRTNTFDGMSDNKIIVNLSLKSVVNTYKTFNWVVNTKAWKSY
jgi:hypothetical protein